MSITTANMEDAEEISTLVASLSHFYLLNKQGSLPTWFCQTLTMAEFERRLSSDNYLNFAYRVKQNIVGYIAMKNKDHVYHLFVAENYQGRGIARQLWEHAVNATQMTQYTVRASLYAIDTYKAFGFTISAEAANKDGMGYQPMQHNTRLKLNA